MSIPCKSERSLLSHDEFTMVIKTHHPDIRELDTKELHSLRKQLRGLREKETRFAEHKGRVVRGKAELRGGSFPGTAEQPKRRKQVFANALKRLNNEINRIAGLEFASGTNRVGAPGPRLEAGKYRSSSSGQRR